MPKKPNDKGPVAIGALASGAIAQAALPAQASGQASAKQQATVSAPVTATIPTKASAPAKAPVQAAPAKKAETAQMVEKAAPVTVAKSKIADMPVVKGSEKPSIRSTLPPLIEGDQYAITELESAPSSLQAGAAPSVEDVVPRSSGAGFKSLDTEMSYTTNRGNGKEDIDLTLPGDVAAFIEESAAKLNKGLSGDKR